MAPLIDGKINWNDFKQWSYLSGFREAAAKYLTIKYGWKCEYRSGDNWGKTNMVGHKTTLYDPGHFECRDKKSALGIPINRSFSVIRMHRLQ